MGRRANPGHAQLGPVHVAFEPITLERGRFRSRVTYTLGERSWAQEFTGANVTDDMLTEEAEAAGLVFLGMSQ